MRGAGRCEGRAFFFGTDRLFRLQEGLRTGDLLVPDGAVVRVDGRVEKCRSLCDRVVASARRRCSPEDTGHRQHLNRRLGPSGCLRQAISLRSVRSTTG